MKNMFYYTPSILLLISSCTNLDEEVYDKVLVSEFGETEDEINALIGPMYNSLREIFPGNLWEMAEVSSDMGLIPTRKGGDWWDSGVHKELKMHT